MKKGSFMSRAKEMCECHRLVCNISPHQLLSMSPHLSHSDHDVYFPVTGIP